MSQAPDEVVDPEHGAEDEPGQRRQQEGLDRALRLGHALRRGPAHFRGDFFLFALFREAEAGFPAVLFQEDEPGERGRQAHARNGVQRGRSPARHPAQKAEADVQDDERVVHEMHHRRGQQRAGADGQQRVGRPAHELVGRLRGALVEDGKEQAAQQAGGDGADVLDAFEHDAAEHRLLEHRGQHRHHEQHPREAEALHRGQRTCGRLVADEPEKFDHVVVEPIQAEKQPAGQRQSDEEKAPVRTPPAEGPRPLAVHLHVHGDDGGERDLVQQVRAVFVGLRLHDVLDGHLQSHADDGDGERKDQAHQQHGDDGAREHDAADRLARLAQKRLKITARRGGPPRVLRHGIFFHIVRRGVFFHIVRRGVLAAADVVFVVVSVHTEHYIRKMRRSK